MAASTTEESVGIECYANKAEGFNAILKERFTDFVVNEIDRGGNVVHLTSLDPVVDDEIEEAERLKRSKLGADPPQGIELAAAASEPEPEATGEDTGTDERKASAEAAAAKKNDDVAPPTDAGPTVEELTRRNFAIAEFAKIAGETDAERLRAFVETPGVLTPSSSSSGAPAPRPLVLSTSNDKDYRASLHAFFGIHFPQLSTDTIEPPGEGEGTGPVRPGSNKPLMCVRVRPVKQKGNGRGGGGQKRSREDGAWGGHQRWPSDQPHYLEFVLCKENKDTGDAIGVLSRILHVKPRQFGFAGTKDRRGVTSQLVTVHKVRAKRLAKLTLHGMKLGNFRYVDRSLGLGDLKGNLFTLTLRGLERGSKETVMKAVNALKSSGFVNYFGLQRFGTHKIPTHAIGSALLRGSWSEVVDLIMQPRDADKDDVAEARKVYKETRDAAAALKLMPRFCLAERGLLEGLVKCKGDIIGAINAIPRPTRMMYVHAYQSYMFNRAASERVRLHGADRAVEGDLIFDDRGDIYQSDDEDNNDVMFANVREVTAEEAARGTYKITDVLLPLPGFKVIYPERVKVLYEDICKAEGVLLEGCAHPIKEYSFGFLTGAYRRLLVKPDKLEFEFQSYSDPKADLTETDMSRILRVPNIVSADGEEKDEKFLALRLSLALPTSSYATMALRELMKLSTSKQTHRDATLSRLENAT